MTSCCVFKIYGSLNVKIFHHLSIALVKFSSRPDDTFLIVGISKDLVLNPRSVNGGELLTYQVIDVQSVFGYFMSEIALL